MRPREQVEPVAANLPSSEHKLPAVEEERLVDLPDAGVDVAEWAADSRVEDVLVRFPYTPDFAKVYSLSLSTSLKYNLLCNL